MDVTKRSNDDGPSDDCVICLSTVTERAITVPCNHYSFDFICLVSWLSERSACPLCKAEVTAVQYDWHSPTDYKTFQVHRKDSSSKPTSTTPPPREYIHNDLPQRPRRRYSQPTIDTALLRRRFVYKEKLYSFHVGANRISAYQNWTPGMMANSPELQSRARTFLRRELRVFAFLYNNSEGMASTAPTTSSNAEWLLSYTVSILKKVDIRRSDGHAEDLLSEFLGRPCARLFLHELNSWLRSPYAKLEEWDGEVQYSRRLPDEFERNGRPIWNNKAVHERSERSS